MTTFLYILLAVFAFGLMILLHELGHFLTARAAGVKIEEFSIGMGPRLCGVTDKRGTAYNLRALPFGGFVSMKGEDEEADGADSFAEKRPWQKFIIVAAGGLMNVLLAFVLMFGIVLSQDALASNTVAQFREGATSAAQLQEGDRIVRVDGTRTRVYYDVAYEIMHAGYKPVDVEVIRDGQKLVLHDVTFPTQTSSGMLFGTVDFVPYAEKKNVSNLLKHIFVRSFSTVKMNWDSLIDMIFGRVSMDAVSGPVGVTVALGDAAKQGSGSFVYLLCVLSMNLGVVNLLPLPALDGGRLVFILYEMIFRKKVPAKYEAAVHFAGIVLLLGLMVLVTFKDIAKLFGGGL